MKKARRQRRGVGRAPTFFAHPPFIYLSSSPFPIEPEASRLAALISYRRTRMTRIFFFLKRRRALCPTSLGYLHFSTSPLKTYESTIVLAFGQISVHYCSSMVDQWPPLSDKMGRESKVKPPRSAGLGWEKKSKGPKAKTSERKKGESQRRERGKGKGKKRLLLYCLLEGKEGGSAEKAKWRRRRERWQIVREGVLRAERGPGISFFSAGRSGENFGVQWEMAWNPDFALNIAHKTGCDFFIDFIFPIKIFSWQSRRRKGYTRLQPVKEQSRKGGRGKIPPDSFEKPTAFREEEKSFFPSDSSLHSVASITSRFVGRGGEYDPHSQSRGWWTKVLFFGGEEKRRRMHSLNVCVAASCFPTLLTKKGRLSRWR